MNVNLTKASIENNTRLPHTMAALFRLNALVLDADLLICHVSHKLSALLSPLNQAIIDEPIANYLQPDDFSALLDGSEQFEVESIVTVTLSKGQKIELYCQKFLVGEQEWTIVNHFELVGSCLKEERKTDEQPIFPQLIISSINLEVVEANPLAYQLTGNDSLIGSAFELLVDITANELKSAFSSVVSSGVATLNSTLSMNDIPVIIKVHRVTNQQQDRLLVTIVVTDQKQESIEQLKLAQQISASIFESRDNAELMMDQFGVISRVNAKMTELLGEPSLIGKRAKSVLPSQLVEVISTSEASVHDVIIEQDGQSHRMQLKQQPLRSEDGAVIGLLLILSLQVDAIDSLKSRALYAASLAAEHAVFITDVNGQVLFVNEVFEQQTGYSNHEIINQDVSILKSSALGDDNYRYLWRAVKNKEMWRGILRCSKRSGVAYWSDLVVNPLLDDEGNVECIVWLSQDITMDKELKRTGTYLANYDVSTGLANAVLAKDRLEGMLGRARRRKMVVAVIYLDISPFELLDKDYSEQIIAASLSLYCERLCGALRAEDSLARMSKGRIAVLLPDLPNVDALEVVSAKIDLVNQQPFTVMDRPVNINFKQGLSYYPEQGTSAESLFKNAEASLLRAYSDHKPIGCFGRSYNKKALIHFQLRRELLETINARKLDVIYQPVHEVQGERVFSIEANLEWRHAKFGLINNDDIYTLAEASGCVQELGFMLIKQVCDDLSHWQQQGHSDFKVGINISHGQLRDSNVVKKIAAIAEEYKISMARLAIELPLSFIATQWLDLDEILQEFSLMGASLQYDKFGERGAYISDLRHFPFSGIKLTQSYIQQIGDDPTAANLVQGIIAMAMSINLEVTAVGVEDLSQLLQLKEMHCHYAQGSLFTPFIARDRLTSYFAQNT